MANFNKSFNFRGGFQVDESTFIVRGGSVGIGSTLPKSRLDVDGTITANGLDISSLAPVGIESARIEFLDAGLIHAGVASISAGIITATTPAGIVTYYGDARFLQGLPTSQWLDIDVGLGYTSIYAAGNVGVDTTDPRYAFQVGGTPFATTEGPPLPAQDGVGIEDGNIYASGIVSTRGQFTGSGIGITNIDGSNITAGQIGSMAYGPLIVTEEVIADRFTGIASTAVNVLPTSQLVFDTARGNEITAVNRFISTEGKFQIGDDESNTNVGEIQVRKATGTTRIYNISDAGSSRIFVGRQRPGGGANKYGGLRYGTEALSGDEDLDLVNYSTGNVNFYTSAGTGSTTGGAFQFIDGDLNYVTASISKRGGLTLAAPVVGTQVLDADGDATFGGSVSAASSITGSAVYTGTLEVSGLISAPGGIELTDPTFTGTVTATAGYITGADPTVGSNVGVKLTSDGSIFANGGGITVGPSATPTFTVTSIGDITGRSLTLTQDFSANDISVATLDVTSALTGPSGFDLTSTGFSVDTLSTPSADITALTGTSVDVDSVAADTFTAGTNILSDSGLVVNTLETSAITGLSLINGPLEITSSVQSTTGNFVDVNSTRVNTDDIQSNTNTEVRFLDKAVFTEDLESSGDIALGGNIVMGDNQFRMFYDADTQQLDITVYDSVGDEIGKANLSVNVP